MVGSESMLWREKALSRRRLALQLLSTSSSSQKYRRILNKTSTATASSIWRRQFSLYETLGMMMRFLLMMLLLDDVGGCALGDLLYQKSQHDEKPQDVAQIDEIKKSETDEIRNCRYFYSKICHNDLFRHQSKNVQEKKRWFLKLRHPLIYQVKILCKNWALYYIWKGSWRFWYSSFAGICIISSSSLTQ